MNDNQKRLKQRALQAAEEALYKQQFVSPIDVFIGMKLLQPIHVDDWRKGRIPYLERVIQGSLGKITFCMKCFRAWAKEKGLKPSPTIYLARTSGPKRELRFSVSGNPEIEQSYRTHYVSPTLSEIKKKKLQEKLDKPPELVVFRTVQDSQYSQCKKELHNGYKRNRYHDDDSECSESNYTEYGINTTEIYAHHFLGDDGNKIKIEKILLSEDALLADEPLIGGPGREVSISEATGNSGATKELWYHRGAVIIWPESSDLEVVGYGDLEYGAHYLETLLKSATWQEESNRGQLLKLARQILDRSTHMQFYKIIKHFGVEPQRPITWARAGSGTCSCEFCQQFNSFLADPARATFFIEKTLKRNLLHVQEIINTKQLDVVGEIISEKNKFSGHFAKNEASYLKTLKLFQTAHNQQKQIIALLSGSTHG